jgi:hypothetical protein
MAKDKVYIPPMTIENPRIIFKNFSGKERKSRLTGKVVNREGTRNFCVVIEDPELAENLKQAGWNIRETKVTDEYDEPLLYLPVEIRYDPFPPEAVFMKNETKTVMLTEDTIGTLDRAKIVYSSLEIKASPWVNDDGQQRIKAYLKRGGFQIETDEFEARWAAEESPEE